MISQKEFDDAMADLVKAEAEIEKLRSENRQVRLENEQFRREIERLQTELGQTAAERNQLSDAWFEADQQLKMARAENARLREALLVNGLRWSAGTKEEIMAEIDRIARGGEYKCRCGRLYRTPGGIEECMAINHTQQEPSEVDELRLKSEADADQELHNAMGALDEVDLDIERLRGNTMRELIAFAKERIKILNRAEAECALKGGRNPWTQRKAEAELLLQEMERIRDVNHTQQEPSDVTVRRERDEEWK
jgi:hypothetical protein